MKRKFEDRRENSYIKSSIPPPIKIKNSYYFVKSIENLKKQEISDELLNSSLKHIANTFKYTNDLEFIKNELKNIKGFS